MRKLIKIILAIFALIIILGLIISLTKDKEIKEPKEPPEAIPEGILVSEIPETEDLVITSIRYILNEPECLDNNYQVKKDFVNDMGCNGKFFDEKVGLIAPRQIYTMDIETLEMTQVTNTDCYYVVSRYVDSKTIMALASCEDTDKDNYITGKDEIEIYLLDLPSGGMDCLTCDYDFNAINNPDYSDVNKKIVFSAQWTNKFHNYIFTIDLEKNLKQITNDSNYMSFDSAWSNDGTLIIYNQLPLPFLEKPSQIWIMDSDGGNPRQITEGGPNPNNEVPTKQYPIGTDADPDLSPDNKQVVFSRLKTDQQNNVFSVFELVIVDVETKEIIKTIDSTAANMVPEWNEGGITFLKMIVEGSPNQVMNRKHSLYLYKEGVEKKLESYPYDIYPLGVFDASWIER